MLLDAAVKRHVVSDVPLGVFLSGGLDSSIISAAATRHLPGIRTVSVVFEDSALSEEPFSNLLAREIGSEHITVPLRAQDLLDSLPGAFEAMDQPTFDGVNTYVVSRAAADSGLKVALSGLGADELFDGYGYSRRTARLEALKKLPAPVARFASRSSHLLIPGARSAKLAAWLSPAYEAGSAYELLRGLFLRPELDWLMARPVRAAPTTRNGRIWKQRLSDLELEGYLKNVLLRDTDAMSMGNSLEVRVPYLDDDLVGWALSLPPELRESKGKRLLAGAHADTLPAEIRRRRKHGFLLPLDGWLKADLAASVGGALRSPPAAIGEILDPGALTDVWRDYEAGRSSWLRPWALYSLCRWTETLA